MNLEQFLHTQTYHPNLVDIILNIKNGSILMYKKLNETSSDIFGLSGRKNIQNEEVQKLDLIANDIFEMGCFITSFLSFFQSYLSLGFTSHKSN